LDLNFVEEKRGKRKRAPPGAMMAYEVYSRN
jgi:hypothetical protein